MAMTTTEFNSSAIIEFPDQNLPLNYSIDPSAQIALVENTPEYKRYLFSSVEDAFVVFSEMYYQHGWVARIDGREPK